MQAYYHPDLTQFKHDRLGMFIHWGIYAMSGTHEWCRITVMHPFFQGRHYVEAVKKCKFHFLRVLYAAHTSFMQQTPETIFRIRKALCSLVMSEDNPRCIPFAICSELSRSRRQNQTPSAKPDLL